MLQEKNRGGLYVNNPSNIDWIGVRVASAPKQKAPPFGEVKAEATVIPASEIKTAALAAGAAVVLNKYKPPLTDEQKLFIATIAGESIGQGETAWRAVGNVIMNRVSDNKHEWKNLNSVSDVIKEPWAFTSYTRKEPQYALTMEYLNNRTGESALYEDLISTVLPVYNRSVEDNTGGAQLFYSPGAMVPRGSIPPWSISSEVVELKVPGISANNFRFYKYK